MPFFFPVIFVIQRNSRTPSIISLSVADDDDTEFLSPSGLYEQEFLKGSSSSLRSDDDSKKPQLSIYHQVATSSVEKSKKNFKMCRMDAPILKDLTDGQIKGSVAKESKVQSDSSKPQTTADADESLPTFVKSREVNLTKNQFNEMRVKAHFSKAKTSKKIFAKWARVASFLGDLTDSTIIEVNMGEVMKVQADSSNTQTTIENLDEEVEHPGEVLNFRREFSGDADSGCSTVDGTSNRVRKPTSTLQVEFGRKHYRMGEFPQIKGTGGGTGIVDMERSSSYQDCLLKAKELFFPNSISRYGTLAEMETPYLANFRLHKYKEEGFTVGWFKEIRSKMNSPRIYLVIKPKTQTTIENLDEEVEHPGEVLNFRREFSGDADSGCSTVDGTSNRVRKPTSTLQVEFGWKHYRKGKFPQIKGTGGGTGIVDMERSSSYHDCLFKAIGLFFPNSISRYGTLAEMETPYLANFRLHKYKEEGFTVGRFKEIRTKMNSPRIYLGTKPKTQTDSSE